MPPNFDTLWPSVLAESPHCHSFVVHGIDHWKRVERNACILASRTGADLSVVRLFALFHDCQRENEGFDADHGKRAAQYALTKRGQWFDLSDEQFDLLHYACTWHTHGRHHVDPTIGTCWDADRLDLGRVGITPDPAFMSTAFGAEIATHGNLDPWLHLNCLAPTDEKSAH